MDENKQMARENLILKIRAGSHLYGTQLDDSDEDYVGVFLPDEDYVFGFKTCDEVADNVIDINKHGRNTSRAVDYKVYEVRKFLRLAMDNNPNILELLFVDEDNLLYNNSYGNYILERRDLFPSKIIYNKFMGYAKSEKKKMLAKEEDIPKKGSHLIRLLLEGYELLQYGRISFPLKYADVILEIKKGLWPTDQIIDFARASEAKMTEAYNTTNLPEKPNFEEINSLVKMIIKAFLVPV